MTADTLALLREARNTIRSMRGYLRADQYDGHRRFLREIEEQERELDAHLETGGWMPIETAPKVGRILVWNAYFGVYSSEYHEEYDNDDIPIAERKVTWRGYPLGLSDIGFGKWYCVPSLWQPLPAAPHK